MILKNIKITVVGLGYVGLPLAKEFSKKFKVIGYDNDKNKVKIINKELKTKSKNYNLEIIDNIKSNNNSNIYIITVPTPVLKNKIPDLSFLKDATLKIARKLKQNDFIIYESTVYPGATEEVLIPILEKISKMKVNKSFYVGYSPERINPGDKSKGVADIKKIISGSNIYARKFIFALYKKIIKAGIYVAPNIKIAEAAKILENVQRDVNISLMNEVSLIFSKMNVDTHEVIKAASTKWNFLKFSPGLVGGHCISVDPYYLKYKSEKIGYSPKVISSGRNVNEKMSSMIVSRVLNYLKKRKKKIKKIRIGVMGITYKENCPDTRNSQVIKMLNLIRKKKIEFQFCDPFVDKKKLHLEIKKFYRKKFTNKFDALILAVSHQQYLKLSPNYFNKILKEDSVVFDVKNLFNLKKLRKDIEILKL
jgi:UDP-N-acetyl-D-glucosamine/UDP-N-acetyl-D-galactosamine dehydrogenase